ncbi:MAG: hypothetical protein IT259_12215 [Saprospiraceae bacterium]|nr:hypothetical protein [Saprospiraceae bacterium]
MTTATDSALLPSLAFDSTLSPETRLWIFLAERPLNEPETAFARQALDSFARQWTAHNQALRAKAEVFQNQIVLLAVDESQTDASGCSIDKSVHFLEELGARMGIDFLEKMRFAWADGERWQVCGRSEFATLIQQKRITYDTLVANTLAPTKASLQENWLVPLEKSWHKRLFPLPN